LTLELVASLTIDLKKLEEDERQIRIIMAEHEELFGQEEGNLDSENPQRSTTQNNLLALPSVSYLQTSTETEQQLPTSRKN
jgi:hypothetical protein